MTGTSVENQDSHPVAKAYGSLGEDWIDHGSVMKQ
jgi:hypothetical protein